MVPILLILVLIVGVGVSVIAVRNRTEHGIESGISSFRREMRALAPRPGDRDPARSPRDPDLDDRPLPQFEQDPGVHVLSDQPDGGRAGQPDAGERHDRETDDGFGDDGFSDDGFGDD